MTDGVGGRLSETDDLVVPTLGDSVLAVRAVVAMCALSARSHDGVAGLVANPEVVAEDLPTGGAPRLRVRLEVVATYGADLPALAAELRDGVADTLRGMTGLEVTAVDVEVTDVAPPA